MSDPFLLAFAVLCFGAAHLWEPKEDTHVAFQMPVESVEVWVAK